MLRKRLQLGLIHVAVAMTLVPINSTLNRVMIKELTISTTLVAILASLPFLFSPIQVAIGSFADRHPVLGWRRTPYIVLGLLLCVSGVILSPRIAYFLAENFWTGLGFSAMAFGAWGLGYNFATVSYFSLATEISGQAQRSRTIAIMFFMMIMGIIFTTLALGQLLDPFTFEALIRSFWLIGIAALLLGILGLVGLEERFVSPGAASSDQLPWSVIFKSLIGNRQAMLFFWYLIVLLTAILGQDILLEPFGAEAFGLPVDVTTRITSIWGVSFLASLMAGGLVEGRVSKLTVARIGSWSGVAAFALIILSGLQTNLVLFYGGVVLLGLATGLATVSNLSLMLDMTISGSVGLFMGAWGMASSLARLTGNILSGVVRDTVAQIARDPSTSYLWVFAILMVMLLVSLGLLRQVDVGLFQRRVTEQPTYLDQIALANETS